MSIQNPIAYPVHEYEVFLQKGSKYAILEAQKFAGKTIIVAQWKGVPKS
jgi:hypothetical protein